MGNDIVSVFIDRKKALMTSTIQLFMQYFVDEKVKLNRTIQKFVAIYFRDFYQKEEIDEQELNRYFSLPNGKDSDLKKSLLSVIYFYHESGMEDKIEEDIRTIVLLSNSFYLSLLLSREIDKNYDKGDDWVPSFFKKYQSKMRLCKEEKKESLIEEITYIVKKETLAYRKFFKCLEEAQYGIELEPLLDFANGYLVRGNYDIKMLSRYSSKEIEQVYHHKNFSLEHLLITLERLSFEMVKGMTKQEEMNHYFIHLSFDFLERETFYEAFKRVATSSLFKEFVVLTFSYHDLSKHMKTAEKLVQDGFRIAVKDLFEEEIPKRLFELVEYVFIPRSFLEEHSRYHALFENEKLRFILFEGGTL